MIPICFPAPKEEACGEWWWKSSERKEEGIWYYL